MAQWINVLQNNSFINLMRLPLLCRISRTCFKVVVRRVKIGEAIIFFVVPPIKYYRTY